jgi:hypothetical protein
MSLQSDFAQTQDSVVPHPDGQGLQLYVVET